MANYNRYVDNTRIVYFDDGTQGNLSLPGMLRVDAIKGNTYQLGPEFTISSLNVSADIVAPGTHYTLPAHNANTYDYEKLGQSWVVKENVRRWTDVALSATGQYQVACATSATPPTNDNKLYVSANYGDTWEPVDTVLNAVGISISGARNWVCVAISESGAYATACVANGSLYTSTDYGYTWMAVANPAAASWSSVAMSANGNYQVAVSNPGFIWMSNNYGATWRQATTVSRKWTGAAISAMGDKVYACAEDDDIYMSRDYGVTWTVATTQPRRWVSVTTSTDGMTVLAATRPTTDAFNQTQDGYLYVSADYGDSWEVRLVDANREWRNVTMSATGQFQVAAASNNFVFVSLDYGFTWVNTLTSKAWTGASISKNAQYVTVCADNEYLYKSYIMTYFYGGVEASTVRTGAVYTPWLSTAYAETNMAIGSSISSITTRTHSMFADRAEMSTIYTSTITATSIDATYIQVTMQSTTQISTTITLANEIVVELLKSEFQDAQLTEISTLFVENTSSLNMYISTLRADTSDLMSTTYASLQGLNLSTGLAQVGRLEVSEQVASSISSINTHGATSFYSSMVGNNMSTGRFQVGAMTGGTVNVLQFSTGILTNGAAQISSIRANNMSTLGAQVGDLLTSSITTHYISSGLAVFGSTISTELTTETMSTTAIRADTFAGNAVLVSSMSTGTLLTSSITSRSLFANVAQLDAYSGTNANIESYIGNFMYVSSFSTVVATAEFMVRAPTMQSQVLELNTATQADESELKFTYGMVPTTNGFGINRPVNTRNLAFYNYNLSRNQLILNQDGTATYTTANNNTVSIDNSANLTLTAATPGNGLIINSSDGTNFGKGAISFIGSRAGAATNDGDRLMAIITNGTTTTSVSSRAAFIGVLQDGAATASATPGRIEFRTNDTASEKLRMTIKSDGNVGIGTSAPEGRFQVGDRPNNIAWYAAPDATATMIIGNGTPTTNTNTGAGTLMVVSSSPYAQNLGASLTLGGIMGAGSASRYAGFARISGVQAQETGAYAGNLVFHVQGSNTGTMLERMRILSGGTIAIGTTNPTTSAALYVQTNKGTGNAWEGHSYFGGTVRGVVVGANYSGATQYATIGGHNAGFTDWADLCINPVITGNVGIGTFTPSVKLEVVGNVRVNGNVAVTGTITCTDVTATSDRRLKENITTIRNPLSTITKLCGVTYNLVSTSTRKVGLIAQDVEEVLPEVVSTDVSENKYKSVAYGNIVAVLIEAVKELSAKVDAVMAR